jgi:anti-anti-sigma factor
MSEFAAEISDASPHVVTVTGELDIAVADQFYDTCRRALGNAGDSVDIALGGVTFIDSTGIGSLVRVHQDATAADKHVHLLDVPRQVNRILDLTGLSRLFDEGSGA